MRAPGAVVDALVVTRRNLLRYVRVPTLLMFSTIQPVMLLLLFTYVFGGAIRLPPGLEYIDFVMPGILVQTAVFGSVQTGIGLAEDLSKGVIDRFRSLPMARSAVLAGRTTSDSIRNLFVVSLMLGVGFLLGFRFHAGLAPAIAAIGLVLLFGHAFQWISALIGLAVQDVEATQAAGFVWIFPLVFASSAFVPVETMPDWMRWFAGRNPVSVTVDALRALTLGGPTSTHMWQALAWMAVILALFVPLAIRRYRRL